MRNLASGRARRPYSISQVRSSVAGSGRELTSRMLHRIDTRLPDMIAEGDVWHVEDRWLSRYAAAMLAAGLVGDRYTI